MRLLLLEDEEGLRSALARHLGRWGHAVVTAATIDEARLRTAEHGPEGLVTDLKLPDGNGLDFACRLGVPYVLMSGYADFGEAVKALRSGCVDFFTKPVAISKLREAVATMGRRNRSGDLSVVVPGPDQTWGLVHAHATGFGEESFWTERGTWSNPVEARAWFDRACQGRTVSTRGQRLLLAELLQAAPAGEAILNRTETWWRVLLRAGVDWEQDPAQRDRRALIEELASRVIFRGDGCLVEVAVHG